MSGAGVDATDEGMPGGRVVIAGSASPEEVSAVVAILSALGGGEAAATTGSTSGWADHGRAVRGGLAHGPGAWRASGRPH